MLDHSRNETPMPTSGTSWAKNGKMRGYSKHAFFEENNFEWQKIKAHCIRIENWDLSNLVDERSGSIFPRFLISIKAWWREIWCNYLLLHASPECIADCLIVCDDAGGNSRQIGVDGS